MKLKFIFEPRFLIKSRNSTEPKLLIGLKLVILVGARTLMGAVFASGHSDDNDDATLVIIKVSLQPLRG